MIAWLVIPALILIVGALVVTAAVRWFRYSRLVNWLRGRWQARKLRARREHDRGAHRRRRGDWDDPARSADYHATGAVPYHTAHRRTSSLPPPSRPYLDVKRERLDPKAALLPLPGWVEYVEGQPVTPWHAPLARAAVWQPRDVSPGPVRAESVHGASTWPAGGHTPDWVRELLTCPVGLVQVVNQRQLKELDWTGRAA